MGLDLASAWILSFFGACAAGGMVGFLVARFACFEAGLGLGLLVPGVVSLGFTLAFADEWWAMTRSPYRTAGTVVAVEDRAANASGTVTTPTPMATFEVGGVEYRVDGGGGSSRKVGDAVTVVYDPTDPRRARFGVASELVGGGVASMLFGTFPLSAGLYFLLESLLGARPGKRAAACRPADLGGRRLTIAANVLVSGILWTAVMEAPVEELLMEGFALVAAGLWLHCLHGLLARADPRWTAGMAVLAINFTAWTAALYVLIFTTPT